jgi:hypothetical protein
MEEQRGLKATRKVLVGETNPSSRLNATASDNAHLITQCRVALTAHADKQARHAVTVTWATMEQAEP